jgi:hypothetical protein
MKPELQVIGTGGEPHMPTSGSIRLSFANYQSERSFS